MIDPKPYDIAVTSVLGPVDVTGLLSYIDEPRHDSDWQREAERMERSSHTKLLRSIGASQHASRWKVQRPMSEGTLAALYGAVL